MCALYEFSWYHQTIVVFPISRFAQKENPDVICHTLHICRTDPGQEHCYLYPKPKVSLEVKVLASRASGCLFGHPNT